MLHLAVHLIAATPEFLKNNSTVEFTSEEIADKIGLSRVTVRRYMNYLLEHEMIIGQMNYETGGRPCMLYRLNKGIF